MRNTGSPDGRDHPVSFTAAEPLPDPRRRLGLVVLLSAAFMDLLDVTVVNIAVPSIRADLGGSYAAAQWITAGYTLTFGLGLITAGRAGDRYGRKPLFLAGMLAFTTASALCGLALTAEFLVAARLLQGLAGALMIPQIMATVFATFPAEERAGASATYGAVSGLAAVVGPVLAAVLLQADLLGLGWRAIFLVNLPVGIAGFVAALVLVPDSRSEHPPRMDPGGLLLVTAAMVLLLLPLVRGPEVGWPAWSVAMLVAAPVMTVGYVLHARRAARRGRDPLVPPHLFTSPGFTPAVVVLFLFSAVLIGYFLALSVTLQAGLGHVPLVAGLVFLPWAVGGGVAAGLSGVLVPRLGGNVPTVGALLMAGGLVVLGLHLAPDTSVWTVIAPVLFLVGVGMGLVLGPTFTLGGSATHPRDAGAAAGTLSAAGQVGSATGAALLGVLYFGRLGGAPPDGSSHEAARSFLDAFRFLTWSAAAALVVVAVLGQLMPRTVRAVDGTVG